MTVPVWQIATAVWLLLNVGIVIGWALRASMDHAVAETQPVPPGIEWAWPTTVASTAANVTFTGGDEPPAAAAAQRTSPRPSPPPPAAAQLPGSLRDERHLRVIR